MTKTKAKIYMFVETIKAMVTGERNQWIIARHLVDELVPEGPRSEIPSAAYAQLQQAQADAGVEVWSNETARSYRRTAAMFGAADVVDGLSWGAHHEATSAGSLDAALNRIKTVANEVGGDMSKVTVEKVRAEVRRKSKTNRKVRSGRKAGKVTSNLKAIANAVAALGHVRNKSKYIAPVVRDGHLADLQRDLAAAEAFVAWFKEAVAEHTGKVAAPANITKPASNLPPATAAAPRKRASSRN